MPEGLRAPTTWGAGFRVWGAGFRVWGAGFRVWGARTRSSSGADWSQPAGTCVCGQDSDNVYVEYMDSIRDISNQDMVVAPKCINTM